PRSSHPKRIGQVVTTQLREATTFTERGGVTVSDRHDAHSQSISIAVADTGGGIAADELDAIFEEYKQVGARKRKIRGTGLGLAIARRIAEAHGGSLTARSKLDVGSTFSLDLPLEPPTDSGGISGIYASELAAARSAVRPLPGGPS